MPKTGEGELAYFRIGKAYYEDLDFSMAGYYLGAFSQRFPYSEKAQESLFLSAMCSVNNSPEQSLDQNDTELAILQQTFLKDEQEQLKTLRRLRPQTENYGTLYNAYCARVLVTDPNHYVEKEIVKRFINNNLKIN